MSYVLIVLALNLTYSSPGTISYSYDNPAVTMQSFDDEAACIHARDVILRRAGEMRRRLDVFCVPKRITK